MTLQELNEVDPAEARTALLRCCGSEQWVAQMITLRPFDNFEAVRLTAERIWQALDSNDWLQAFMAHPKIGAEKLAGWCSQEQSGLKATPKALLQQLAHGNEIYEQRFGWIFLVNASGKSGSEILALLQARLQHKHDEELLIAARQQAEITALRLHKLLNL